MLRETIVIQCESHLVQINYSNEIEESVFFCITLSLENIFLKFQDVTGLEIIQIWLIKINSNFHCASI